MKVKMLRIFVTLLAALTVGLAGAGDSASDLQITSLGNEGFLIEAGGRVVMIDALYVGLPGYVAPTGEQRGARERAAPPFDTVDLVLATHHHGDHFDAEVVARHLEANPRGVLVTTPTAVDLIRREGAGFTEISDRLRRVYPEEGESVHLEVAGIDVEVLNLHHGRRRDPLVENLGFIVRMGGFSFLHMGDTEATAEEIGSLELRDRHIDVAFVPFWLLEDRQTARGYLEAIGAAKVVAMHIPAPDAPPSYLAPGKDLEDLIRLLDDITPGVVILAQVMDTRVFEAGQ